MKQLREYLFSKIKKDPPVWYYTENIDAKMSEFTAEFIELTGESNSDKFSGKLLADIHTLQFVSEDNKTHYFSFYSMYGLPKHIVHKGIINRIANNDSLGLILAVEEETEEDQSVDDVLNNNIPDQAKREALYFVYRNSRKEVQIIDMKNFQIESYLDNSKIVKEEINNLAYMDGHIIVEVVYTMTDKNEFGDNLTRKYLYTINETYDNENDNTTDVNLISLNIYNLLEEDILATTTASNATITIRPMTYDVFEVNINRTTENGFINNIYIYSSRYNTFINKFNIKDEPNVTFKILNVLGDIDNGSITVLFKDKLDHEKDLVINDILVAVTKAKHEEEYDKYYTMPEAHKMLLQKVIGLDIIYTVTQDPDNPNAEAMSQFNFFSIDENGKLKIDTIKTRSIPTEIHLNEESGMLTFIYSLDLYYHMVCYFYDGVELMKYSNVQLYPTEHVEKAMLDFKAHLAKIEKSQELLNDEMENLHHYHTMLLSTDSDGREFITSSHFVNLTTDEINYDLTKMNITRSGKFIEIREDRLTKFCMRVQSHVDPKEEILEELKELQMTMDELDEDNNKK